MLWKGSMVGGDVENEEPVWSVCMSVCLPCRVCQWIQEVVVELAGASSKVRWQPDPAGMVSKGRIVLQQEVGSGKSEM